MIAWSNKHVIIATLMAPVLAVIAYFGTSALVGETPQAAEPGGSYKLVEKPNCRYNSGMCGLKNVDFELTLTFEWRGDTRMLLKLKSENPLDGVLLAMAENDIDEDTPVPMQPAGNDGLNWTIELARPDPEIHRLHLVASTGGVFYLGDVATKFTGVEIKSD